MSMARTNIDIDEEACRRVMERFNLTTMKDAVNLALRTLAIEPMTLEEALAMEGTRGGPVRDLIVRQTSSAQQLVGNDVLVGLVVVVGVAARVVIQASAGFDRECIGADMVGAKVESSANRVSPVGDRLSGPAVRNTYFSGDRLNAAYIRANQERLVDAWQRYGERK